MMKTSATRTAILLFLVTVFLSTSAFAESFPNFRLRIEDTATGAGVVITDNSAGLDGDSEAGAIFYNEAIGDFFVHVTVAYTEPMGSSGARLSLSSYVTRNNNSAGQIRFTLEDSGYPQTVPATALFSGILAGADVDLNPLDKAQLVDGATSASFQTWVNTANESPAFGADGVYNGTTTDLNPATVSVPVGSLYVFAGGNAGKQYTDAFFSDISSGGVTIAGPYSIHSQATIDFAGNGSAGFSLAGEVRSGQTGPPLQAEPPPSVPEPTSLLLLGSSLVGLGLLRRKKEQTA